MERSASPLLEFDSAPKAFIEPTEQVPRREVPPGCVVTFFGDVVRRLLDQGRAQVITDNAWEDGPHPLIRMEHQGQQVAVLHSGVGASLSAALLEEVVAMGCRAFVVCGGAGALHRGLNRGHLVVVESALRDEGTSHHYAPAARWIEADRGAVAVVTDTLTGHKVPFVTGRTWTTDAPYRETPDKIANRRREGCITVEMEAAALIAVAAFRGVPLAQILYAGDDLSGEHWDNRSWQTQSAVRENLLELAATAVLRLAD